MSEQRILNYWKCRICHQMGMEGVCPCVKSENRMKEQVIVINKLIRDAIDHGGDAGGPYFCYGDNLYKSMIMLREKIFGKNSGICIYMCEDDYPYFALIEDEDVFQHKEME